MVAARSGGTAKAESCLFSRATLRTVKSACPQRADRHQGAGERSTVCSHQNLLPLPVILLHFAHSPLGTQSPDKGSRHEAGQPQAALHIPLSRDLAPHVTPRREAEARLRLKQVPVPD